MDDQQEGEAWGRATQGSGLMSSSPQVAQLVATASPARLSQGAFAWPAWGELTSGYGVSRTYNGRLAKGYFHQ